MPVVHQETFQVRYAECDAYEHLNNVHYLRWMQEAAFGASAAGGYDLARYAALGRVWLVRETEIEYLAPLKYGDVVTLQTWVENFRQFRSLRRYTFTQARTGQVVARAATDWVYVDTATRQPVPVPPDMQQAFFPDGAPPEAAPPARRPPLPAPPPNVFTMRRRVEWRDIDSMWHVSNATYLAYLEEASLQVSAAHGWPLTRLMAEGLGLIARQHWIKYRQPAQMGDELVIATWYSNARSTTALRHYTIRRAADAHWLVQACTRWVWVDLKTGRPTRIPPHFLDAFADNLAPERPASK
jgi:acyl-CoA thioester hydrolase